MEVDDDGARGARGGGGNDGDKGAARSGLIGVNNLNYRMEPDLSVAVNCTDKNHFFQSQTYENTQRAVCVLNSGADYIDPRRSFLCFTVELPDIVYGFRDVYYTQVSASAGENVSYSETFAETISFGDGYDGGAGSALNLIEQITISSRSGDELSRVERCNLLAYYVNAYTRDKQWNDTVGEGMGVNVGYQVISEGGRVSAAAAAESRLIRVSIPMYCLSGMFNYDKLLPSMLMSGLRIEIRWEAPERAFVRHLLDKSKTVLPPPYETGKENMNAFHTTYLSISERDYRDSNFGTGMERTGVKRIKLDGSEEKDPTGADFNTWQVPSMAALERGFVAGSRDLQHLYPGATASYWGQQNTQWETFATQMKLPSYRVKDIYFQLKSIQLTDSIQRIMNEHSATNGLEIVYTDYNNTQIPTKGQGPLFTEVRHAASRALGAFCVTRALKTINSQGCSSFASTKNRFSSWHWRLGSLYFPHQPIKADTPFQNLNQTYTYALDAFGKLAGAARAGVTYKDWLTLAEKYPTTVFPPDLPQYSALHTGIQCIPVSLERSTLFNLSGIPINNSRVLSFHGEFKNNVGLPIPYTDKDTEQKIVNEEQDDLLVDVFLRYVRLARVFMNNVEVEQ